VANTRVELIATGDELLNGSVVDTNSPWLMERLVALGLPVWRKTIIGDDHPAIVAALRLAAEDSDVAIVSGGLGPTSDDLTAACAADAAGVELRLDPATLKSIEARLSARGFPLSSNNRKQALVPTGATIFANRFGTAPMFELPLRRARFFFLPGVPREFFGLVEEILLPALSGLAATAPLRRTKVLKTYGLPESQLDQKLNDLPSLFPGLSLGYRTTLPENHAKLTTVGTTAADNLKAATVEARRRLGLNCFAEDESTFSAAVVATLLAHGATLAVAESITAGRIASLIAETPGVSKVLRGGFVTYTDETKHALLGVPRELIAKHGAVSGPVAEAMAVGARERAGASYAVATTGLAGPEGDAHHPIGTVFTALASESNVCSIGHRFPGDRAGIREFAAYAALDVLRRDLLTRSS
jgi:nicotinamide-nucleotide amidase